MPAGRPTKYDPAYCERARKLCRLGATDQEIADFFDVHLATLYRWKEVHEEFCEALKEAKAEADARVVDSLYHKAVGYTFESEKVFQFQGQIVRTPTREHVPPDTTAAIFWLKNRQPDKWRDVQVRVNQYQNMTDEELDARLRALAADPELRDIIEAAGLGCAGGDKASSRH